MRKKLLSFHCEVSIQRNGIDVPLSKSSKSKIKAFHLIAYYENEVLSTIIPPSVHICDLNSEEAILYKFPIYLIKKIMRPYILEGKLTIEINDETPSSQSSRFMIAGDMSLKNSIKVENSIFIFVSQSNKEMLNHFCQLISETIAKIKEIKANAANTAKDQPQNQNIKGIHHSPNGKKSKIQQEEETKKNNIEANGRRKINRDILTSQPQKPAMNPKEEQARKRPFNSMKENTFPPTPNINPTPKPNNKEVKTTISKQFFENLPEVILERIVAFLHKTDYKKLILLNKEFYNLVWKNIRHLNLNSRPEIPPNMLRKFLHQLQSVNSISFGRLKNINPGFLAEILGFKFPLCLKEIDLSRFAKASDKILKNILLNCKGLEIIRLPYMSQISKDSLLSIQLYIKNLKYLELRYDGSTSIQSNANITDMSICNVIERNSEMTGFDIAYVSNVFLESFLKETIPESMASRLRIIKITNVVFVNNVELLENLKFLKTFTNLEYLKILNIVLKNQYNRYDNVKPPTKIFVEIFKGCGKLSKIKFGGWCNNEIVILIAENLKGLREVSFKNNEEIEDGAMEILLNSLNYLEALDISQCSRLNGHCLEGIVSEKLKKLVVSYDDYNKKCTEALLKEKGLNTRLINKVMKKKT